MTKLVHRAILTCASDNRVYWEMARSAVAGEVSWFAFLGLGRNQIRRIEERRCRDAAVAACCSTGGRDVVH